VHGEPEQCSENADFNHHHQDCRCGCFNNRWTVICAAGVELHYAGGVRNRFNAGKRKHDANEAGPVLGECSVQRLQMSERLAEVGQAKETQNDHYERGRKRNEKREAAGLFWSEQVEQSDDKDRSSSKFFWMRHAQILKRRKRADRSSH